MSFFRLPKLFRGWSSKEGSTNRSGLTGRSAKESRRRRELASPRRLRIDPLESRELLSVSPADTSDVLASQTLDLYNAAFPEANLRAQYPAASQFTDAAKALAADNSGDFVITWTRNDPVVDSCLSLWGGADWLERECYDLFGIVFKGHPDLRRLLLPPDFTGHPLRKDFPLEGWEEP
jgi:NADH:ubiquinone oxidoreductase subunit C